ncbi:MAG: VCBS repeat-containing protein [Balneolaceae bacterium]
MYRSIALPILVLFFLLAISCSPVEEKRFTLLPPAHTGIHFENRIEDTPEFNILNYLYFYDGGGVAVGDINNDGLSDIFLVGNETENGLYLNQGNFEFEDITESAGIAGTPGSWSTGVAMGDVNGDGYLDIYVSRVNYLNKSGANQLFINNGDGTFAEMAAEYGLDFTGYSTQAVFFDYNNNGRLDLFLLNHSFHSDRTYGRAEVLRAVDDPKAGDRLFRNDGDTFTDVTEEAGIQSSALGYGLGVAVSDINKNGRPDIYVGNDFHEDDYLYLNNGDGTFTEALYSSIGHTSSASMGNDIADFTNDGYVDIVSLDMMPGDRDLFMRSGGPDLYVISQTKQEMGFGAKNARNTLQLNRGNAPDGTPLFSEIAFASGVATTDWSWASLFMDMDNDGLKDLFVTNGMGRRPNDLDFVRIHNRVKEENEDSQNQSVTRQTEEGELSDEEMELIKYMPELRIPNYAFQNNGYLSFSNRAEEWGLDQAAISNGAAYADLDNDGRLDLVVNNINEKAFIYRNNTPADSSANYLKIKLNGSGMNTFGIGSKVILYQDEKIFYQEQMLTRGFQSSVDPVIHIGLGDIRQADSLLVIWPDRSYQTLDNIKSNRLLQVYQEEASGSFDYSRLHRNWENSQFINITEEIRLEYSHRENEFNDFSREPLMPYKLSTQGPALAVGDVNGDELDDFYIGGAKWQAGKLFLQQPDGSFQTLPSNDEVFESDRAAEDVDATFLDATGNGHLDLYIVSGGGELTGIDEGLRDRLYINEGNGEFEKSSGRLPEIFVNGSVVRAADFDHSGSVDLFVGGRSIPYRYGDSPRSFLLSNDGSGYFSDVTEKVAPILMNVGMVTDAQWANIGHDTFPDLVVAGEWMPVQLFENDGSSLVKRTEEYGLSDDGGLWQNIHVTDLDGNGQPDIIAGNFGRNSRLQASGESPVRLYVNDFDGDGQSAPLIAKKWNGSYYPFEQLDELLTRHRFLTGRINSYRDFAGRTIEELFDSENLESSIVKEITELGSVLFMNRGDGTFQKTELPTEVQHSPIMAIHTSKTEGNKVEEILMGGNLYDVKPSFGGRQDAGYGVHLLNGNPTGIPLALALQTSGFYIPGEVRAIREIGRRQDRVIVVVRSGASPLFFKPRNP